MTTILIGLAVTAIALLTIPLALITAGIHRQERAGSLAARPSGLTAALARTVLDLRAAPDPIPATRRAPRPAPAAATRQARP